MGPQGPKGDTGTGLDIKGTYESLEALQAGVQSPAQGDMYNVGAAAPYTIYMWDTTDTPGWKSQGQLQGAKGDTGEQGPAGETGPKGDAGDQGPKGDTGPAGADGGYYSPVVDSSGNLTWTPSKSGMPSVDGANIRGPAGPSGADGEQGPEGQQGPAGANATINGVNALTLAVTGGLTGSQSGNTYTISGANLAKKPIRRTVLLNSSGWSDNTQTVTVSGVVASETAQLITPTPAIASQSAYYEAGIMCTGQAANSLTFTCQTVPTSNLTVYVVIQPLN